MDLFKYYSLTSYQKRLQSAKVVLSDYKVFDNREDDKIHYVIFDIKSFIEENGIITNDIKYLSNLEFVYDLPTNAIFITKLPIMNYDNDNISVFTSDILEIIKKCLSKYTSFETIKVVLKPLVLFAYSDDVKFLINESENIRLIDKIVNRTTIARESLKRKIEKDKIKLDEQDKRRESVLEKRKVTFGIKKEDFKSNEEYIEALNEKIVEYAKKQVERYSRHLNICEEKYAIQIRKVFLENKDFFVQEYVQFIEDEDNRYKGLGFYREFPDDLIEDFIKKIVDIETRLVAELREEIEPDWKNSAKESVEVRQSRREYEYTYRLSKDFADSYYIDGKYVNFRNHPIYESEDKKYIFKMINLALYIYDLNRKLEYFNNIIANPSVACLEYEKDNILWGNIMELPYFFKVAQDNFQHSIDHYNLLMIKPGVTDINLDHLIIVSKYINERFRGNADDTKAAKYEYHKDEVRKIIEKKDYDAKRLIVTIPDSLNYNDVKKVITFGIKYGFNINFICESLNMCLNVKRIIILEELKKRRKRSTFIGNKGNIFVNIDPNYYQTYFTNLPSNKAFWHMYDYSSKYQHSRYDVNSLTSLIYNCINANSEKHNGKINYEEVEEWLLGTFGELKFEKFELDNYDAIDVFDMLWYQPSREICISHDIFGWLAEDFALEEEKEQTLKRVEAIRQEKY